MSIGNIIFKESSINLLLLFIIIIAFKDMLKCNAMVKGMLPQVKVLFVFPLMYRAFFSEQDRGVERSQNHSAALVNTKLPGNDS